MEKDTLASRLHALDGLRGFAILLVFLNHINTAYIAPLFPTPLFGWIFSNGVTGVTLLFILSGFLMAYLYPQPVALQFLQKRYTRIFPLFLTMSAVMMAYRLQPHAPWYIYPLIIITSASCVHIIWVYGLKKLSGQFHRALFVAFLLLQLVTGAFYTLWVMRHPAIVFSQFPLPIREGLIWLVNSTLTLPLGDYIPMIDGVYWTLAAEVLFYLLYPFLFAPFVAWLPTQNKKYSFLFILSLLPFFGMIDMISKKVAGLSMLQLELFYYFVAGVTLGTMYRNNSQSLHTIASLFTGKLALLPVIFFLFLLATVHTAGILVSREQGPWIRLLYAIPFTLLIATMLNNNTLLAKIMGNRILTFIGTISYSLYLSHAILIHVGEMLFQPTSIFTNILYVLGVFLANVILASLLFYLLEKPYFIKRATSSKIIHREKPSTKNPQMILATLIGVYTIIVCVIYSTTLNFFSLASPATPLRMQYPKISDNNISLAKYRRITLDVVSSQEKFGVLTMHVTPEISKTKSPQPQTITFSIKESQSPRWYATSSYTMQLFEKPTDFPFGFPEITNAKGKTYTIQLELMNQSSHDGLLIEKNSIATVYPVNKKELVTNSDYLMTFIKTKLMTLFTNNEARLALIPVVLLSLFLLPIKRSKQ